MAFDLELPRPGYGAAAAIVDQQTDPKLLARLNEHAKETGPAGRDPHQPGAKLDAGKAPAFRGLLDYFPRAALAVADVSAFGASKYTWRGWETVPEGIERYGDALVRHIAKERIEGPNDSDSGLRHAAHAAWCALARLELLLRGDEA